MKNNYVDKIDLSITEYLNRAKNDGIKGVLDLIDLLEIPYKQKKRLREAILNNFNNLYGCCCRVITCIQEDNGLKDISK